MPKLTIDERTVDVPQGQRLVLAIEEQGINIGHRCGGKARCTTCRVEFLSGEPDTMTRAEYKRLKARELLGQYRLACQIVVDHDLAVHAPMTLESEGWTDTGPVPEPAVAPEARWYPLEALERADEAAAPPIV
jgi:ferredoxin